VAGLISVLLVDDHPLVTDGLRAAIDTEPGMRVVAVARALSRARECLRESEPTVAVVDVRLPDGSGFDLVDPGASTRWLLLSSFGTPQYIEAATQAGAAGYFLKTTPTPQLVNAITIVASGGLAFDPELLRRRSLAGRWHPLSEREREVVRLVLAGRTNDEIGLELGIARKTVETHLARLFERFGCSSRTDLAVRAEREGWLDLPAR
jgi:DNA-binding NarL/FixJ family response regulator